MARSTRLAKASLVIALAMGAAIRSTGQPPPGDSTATWQAWVSQSRTEVERVLGRSAVRVDSVKVVESIDVARAFPLGAHTGIEGIGSYLLLRFPHLDSALWAAGTDAYRVNQQATLAYGRDGAFIVCPVNAAAMTRWHNSLRNASPELIKLAVVHEVARLTLEDRYKTRQLAADCHEAEEWLALQALVEGRAQWVTLQVARRLGMTEMFPLLAQRFLYVPDVSPEPGLRTTSQSFQRARHWAYTRGLAFWTHLESQGRIAEGAVFARPPRQAQWVEQPELYVRAMITQRPDLAAVLSQLETALPVAEWTAQQQAWTPEMMMQVAALLGDKTRAEKTADGWDEGRSLVWTWKKNPSCLVALSVVRYESVAGARGYFGFALDLQRKRDELSNTPCKLPMRVVESKIGNMPLTGVDESILFEKRMQLANSQETVPMHVLLVRHGAQVIEITWHGLSAEGRWAQHVVGQLATPGPPALSASPSAPSSR